MNIERFPSLHGNAKLLIADPLLIGLFLDVSLTVMIDDTPIGISPAHHATSLQDAQPAELNGLANVSNKHALGRENSGFALPRIASDTYIALGRNGMSIS